MPAIKPSTYARSSRTSIEALTKIAAVLHVYELSALNMPLSGQLQTVYSIAKLHMLALMDSVNKLAVQVRELLC
jgi:hypothetical protein